LRISYPKNRDDGGVGELFRGKFGVEVGVGWVGCFIGFEAGMEVRIGLVNWRRAFELR
jgi:hypothetical protein